MTDDMENIESDGPAETEWSDPVDDYEEPEEAKEEPTAMTGGMGVVAGTRKYLGGGITSIPRGSTISWTTSPPFAPSTSPSTTWTTPMPATTKTVAAPEPKDVDLPRRVTKKVLIAFIDEDEEDDEKNVVWAANLRLKDVELNIEPYGESEITITLSLKDVYGNKE